MADGRVKKDELTALRNRIAELEAELAEVRRCAGSDLAASEHALRQAQRIDAIGRLAGGVAHDFNNLLSAIIGHAEMMLERMAPCDPNFERIERIHRAGKRGAALTGQLLAFGRREMLQKKVLDLNDVLSDFGNLARGLLPGNIEFEYILDKEPDGVMADESQLEQVILNLVINAGDAMPEGGTLTLRTDNVVLTEADVRGIPGARCGSFVRLRVQDTGKGIDGSHLSEIFEPFFTTKDHGTGLGLSVVYGLTQQHGGWVNVTSEPEKGATFDVYLPAVERETEEFAVDFVPLHDIRGRGQLVLVVEDEEALRELSVTVLEENGYRVIEAGSVAAARAALASRGDRIQLLFSDVVLPDGTGLDVVALVQEMHPKMPILMTSGYADQRSQWAIIEERGLAFIRKPYTPTDLLIAAREALQSS